MTSTPDPDGSEGDRRFQQAVDAVAAVGGAVLLLYGFGGLLTALRLGALDLPVDATVATLPKSALLVASLRAIGPGLAFAFVLWLLTRRWRSDDVEDATAVNRRRLKETGLLLVGVAVVGPLLLYRQQISLWSVWGAGPLVLLLVGVRQIWWSHGGQRARTDLALIVVLTGIVVNGVAEYVAPTPLDYVTVRLKDGGATDGYYLASDSNALYLAPNVFDHTVGDVSVIPRGQVASFKVESYLEPFRKVYGWERPFGDARKQAVFNVLVGIRTDPGWVYPPALFARSAEFLAGLPASNEFYDVSHPHEEPGKPPVAERAALEDVLLDPAVYDGRVILTHGRVTRDAADGAGKRLVVVRPSERDDRREAYCTYGPGTREALASESRVRLRAVVVATGTFRSPAGKPEAGMALVCSDVGG